MMNLVSHPDCNENSDPRRGLRSTLFIVCFPCDLRWRRLPRVAQRRILYNLASRMISGFFASANVSQFAHVSLICGSGIAHVQGAPGENRRCTDTRNSVPAKKTTGRRLL